MARLAGRIALVTGAASGIGRAGALALAREGAHVIATDLDAAGAETTAAAIRDAGGRAIARGHDVGEERDWQAAMAATLGEFGRLDILVNNAGMGASTPLPETSLEEWRRLMRVNLDGVFLGTREAIAAMRPSRTDENAPWGSIVNISSVLGLVGSTETAAYSASKGGVRLFTKAAAVECGAKGWRIRVNSIHPGYIQTPMIEGALRRRAARGGADPEAARSFLQSQHPIGRLGIAEDIAAGIVFLASDESSFMTGSELVIDGGYTAR